MDNQQTVQPTIQSNPVNIEPKKTNWLVIILCILLFVVGLFGAYYFGKSDSSVSQIVPTVIPTSINELSPTETSTVPSLMATNTPSDSVVGGKVTGKLCYPAEVLPAGTIEAKNTTTTEVIVQNYPGSAAGGKNSYSFDLKPGSYYLRYKISDSLTGYHTETCKTGSETSCAATNPRVLIPAVVENSKTVDSYDLCDFYYSDSTKPTF